MLVVALGGCASMNRDFSGDWPRELPPSNYFVISYERDALNQEYQALHEYMYWVRKFSATTPSATRENFTACSSRARLSYVSSSS
ncbi:MAG: hypothetical protein AAGA95_10885, partial [Pseudomonadota bacterium]